jgi:2-phosphosulfolactate phosphatase
MMKANIVFTADAVRPEQVRGTLCVVIDVLRASTTIVTALANGCPAVIPVETPGEARALAQKQGCLLGGEREGLRIEGFDFGNSPLEYVPEKVSGRPIAFTTTNGTRAIRACAHSDTLVVASFLNGRGVIRLLEREQRDILIVCAGTRGKASIEDTVCGGMLLEGVHAEGTAEVDEALTLWGAHKSDLPSMMKSRSDHGRTLLQLGFERDIDFAAGLNSCDIIAIRDAGSIVRESP